MILSYARSFGPSKNSKLLVVPDCCAYSAVARWWQAPIIGVGGIFTAEDAYEKIRAGASAVQIYTGFVYEGPAVVKRINQGLIRLMERDGLQSIAEAVGTDN